MPHPLTNTRFNGKRLTFKQRKWLKEYQRTGNASEAAMIAYNCKTRKTAGNIGSENLKKLGFEDLMDAVGLTEEYLLKKTKEGLESERILIKGDKVVKVPDNTARSQFNKIAWKLRGKMDTSKLEVTGKDGSPIDVKVLAGLAFIPNNQNYADTNTEPERDATQSNRGAVSRPDQIQSADMAPKSEEDNNSDK